MRPETKAKARCRSRRDGIDRRKRAESCRDIPERMEMVGLAANSNAEKLAAAANEDARGLLLVDESRIDIACGR